MNKQIIYTNLNEQQFSVEKLESALGDPTIIDLKIFEQYDHLYFINKYEVGEFCKILQEVKKEVWGD